MGNALRWFDTLGYDVQNDWDLLRRALLVRYPPLEDRSAVVQVPSIIDEDTTAMVAADTVALGSPTHLAESDASNGEIVGSGRKGRILVIFDNQSSMNGYVDRTESGNHDITQDEHDALLVELVSSSYPPFCRLKMLNSKTSYEWLGVGRTFPPFNSGFLMGCTGPRSNPLYQTAVWSLSTGDFGLSATWSDSSAPPSAVLDFVAHKEDGLRTCRDFKQYSALVGGKWHRARLVFELI